MDTHKKLREHISALADGELSDSERELALAALATPTGQAAWRAYHLAGDALRAVPDAGLSAQFDARLAARLAAEPPYQPQSPQVASASDQPAAVIVP